jgi:hypothetical protein
MYRGTMKCEHCFKFSLHARYPYVVVWSGIMTFYGHVISHRVADWDLREKNRHFCIPEKPQVGKAVPVIRGRGREANDTKPQPPTLLNDHYIHTSNKLDNILHTSLIYTTEVCNHDRKRM